MPATYSKVGHIICEGDADKAFLERLLADRGIAEYDISHPVDPGGTSGFNVSLRAMVPRVESGALTRIAIIADNDTKDSFDDVRKEIKKANGGKDRFPVPHASGSFAQRADFKLLIVMVPSDARGNLE